MIDLLRPPRLALVFGAFLAVLAALTAETPLLAEDLDDSPEAGGAHLLAAGLPHETLPVDGLERGQKGYGLSVFAGSEPERFEVEVIGTWRGSSPELTYVLARLSGKDLERSGVLQGMSGSPVFIDDKLVGAVSFSFSFGLDPIAGITPIDSMRSLASAGGGLVGALNQPATEPVAVQARPKLPRELVPSFEQVVARELDPALLGHHLALLAPPTVLAGARAAVSWSAGGFGEQVRGLLEAHLGALAPGQASGFGGALSASASRGAVSVAGSGPSGLDASLAAVDLGPGDAVALVLVRGDLSLAAHGTVTDRVGDSIFAFGHPVYSLGPTRLPMAESEVVTTIPSVANSFKLSNAGRLIGVFDQDREPGAHGVLGAEPTLVPMEVGLRGLSERDYRMQLADSPLFKPTLIAVTALGAINSGSYSTGFQGLDLTARYRLRGQEDLVLEQSFDGNQAAMNAVIHLLTYAAFLELNDLQPTTIEGVELSLRQYAEPRLGALLGVRAEKRRVAPGEEVELWLDIQPYRGERERRSLTITVPEELGNGSYYVLVGDGTSLDAARLAVEKRRAETFEQQLEMMRSFHSKKQLHVLGLARAAGRSVAGGVMPDLPPSVRSVYGGEGQALHLRVVDRRSEPLEEPLDGVHRVDFEVRRPAGR